MPSSEEYIKFEASTIETIDTGIYAWLKDSLDCTQRPIKASIKYQFYGLEQREPIRLKKIKI